MTRTEAELAVLRETLEKLAKLGNEPFEGTSDGNRIAQHALATNAGKEAAEVLRCAVMVVRAAAIFDPGSTTNETPSEDTEDTPFDQLRRAVAAYQAARGAP